MKKVLAVVVLFNPDNNVSVRINLIKKQTDFVIVYDNSTDDKVILKNRDLFSDIENVYYFSNGKNNGLGVAFNFAINYAIEHNFDYYVTFDQDTLIVDDYISNMVKEIKKDTKIGVLGPIYKDSNIGDENSFPIKKGLFIVREKLSDRQNLVDVIMLISSGSVYSLNTFKKIGLFEEKLFIDGIDNEFCLRLLKFGYRVCVNPKIIINHALGNKIKKKFIFSCAPKNYPPYRRYYMTRNRFFVYKKYLFFIPSFVIYDFIASLWDLFKIIVFEDKKIEKICAYFRGIKDFLLNKYGAIK